MAIAFANYAKKTPRVAKLVGDIMLFAAPLLSTVVVAAPFSEVTKTWLLFGLNMALVIGKIITKFIDYEENPDITDGITGQ